jgi:YesN/AraC family two-component response regulator
VPDPAIGEHPVRRILIVEDEPDILASIKDLLEMSLPGVTVSTAVNGMEALRMIPEVAPHLIITDYKMPGMNGLEFLEAARARAPETPRILMTAFPDLEVAVRAINDAHIENFLAKPVEPDHLLAKVTRIFTMMDERHSRERELARTMKFLREKLVEK